MSFGGEFDPLRFLAEFHGHLGWLAAAALVHPPILLWSNPKRKIGLSVALACGLVSFAALAGALVYADYRERIKPLLFVTAPNVLWMFERKEHLAVGAAGLAWIGALTSVAARRVPEARSLRLFRASRAAFTLSAALAIVVASLGTYVASIKSF